MKTRLFLFAASLLLFACSSDDNGPEPLEELPIEFNIKKFTRLVYLNDQGVPEDFREEFLFDENGNITRIDIYDNLENTLLYYYAYEYNPLGLVYNKKGYYPDGGGTLVRHDEYHYNETEKIEKVIFNNGNGDIVNIANYSYAGNQISIDGEAPHYGGMSLYFDTLGKLIETFRGGGDPIYSTSTETISYSGENITNLHYESSLGSTEDYIFEYDDKINPTFENFNANFFNWANGFPQKMTYFKYFFSNNNYTKITYSSSYSQYNYTEIKTTEYNNEGYPVSAQIKRNDVLYEELIYEYY